MRVLFLKYLGSRSLKSLLERVARWRWKDLRSGRPEQALELGRVSSSSVFILVLNFIFSRVSPNSGTNKILLSNLVVHTGNHSYNQRPSSVNPLGDFLSLHAGFLSGHLALDVFWMKWEYLQVSWASVCLLRYQNWLPVKNTVLFKHIALDFFFHFEPAFPPLSVTQTRCHEKPIGKHSSYLL